MTLHDCLHRAINPSARVTVQVRDHKYDPLVINTPCGQVPMTVEEMKSLICDCYLAVKSLEIKNGN